MCIEFICINNSPAEDGYRLILANNRDEYYNRPAKPAHFWQHSPDCLSGLDAMPGRENGTWFAVSKSGKIGCLLNILTPEEHLLDKKGRGFLVVDYVNQVVTAAEYLERLSNHSSDFGLFNLVLLEQSNEGRWQLHYYTNSPDSDHGIVMLEDGIHGASNSVLEKPYQKVLRGKESFATIIDKFGSRDKHEELEKALLEMMHDRTSTLPDPQLKIQGGSALDDRLREQRSGIYVYSPQVGYGTRTTTFLTVSADNCCIYTEYTMKEPIIDDKPEWQKTSYTLQL